MSGEAPNPYELSDDEFDALEEVLTSEVVPEDCMDLEMLDGYLSAVIAAPSVIPLEAWMPAVWSAHADDLAFGSGANMQRAIRLVRGYYNELTATIGEHDGWEPFCYAGSSADELAVGEEWVEGFMQGLELWPADWAEHVPSCDAQAVTEALEALVRPWEQANNEVSCETRLEWLGEAREVVCEIRARWVALELPQPEPVELDAPQTARPQIGRNDACSCGSGKKYKKCCGAT